MKTAELTGAALDWAVAKCEGDREANDSDKYDDWDLLPYSTDWCQGGPIIEREKIGFWLFADADNSPDEVWMSECKSPPSTAHGPTPLIAAMRCYVSSKLGDEVEIPKELT